MAAPRDPEAVKEAAEAAILSALESGAAVTTLAVAAGGGFEHEVIVGSMKSLEADKYLVATPGVEEGWKITEDAQRVLRDGQTAEWAVYQLLPASGGVTEASLADKLGAELTARGKGKAMGNKWVSYDKATGLYTRTAVVPERDEAFELLRTMRDGGAGAVSEKGLKDLTSRKWIEKTRRTFYTLTKGEAYAPLRRKLPAEITKEMLDSGSWATETFKVYNFESAGKDVGGGHEHVLMKVRGEFRQILLEMGFSEMPTSRFVESSFWNFDALFQPQSHPSRDMHDTFFIKSPASTVSVPEDYLARVAEVHEKGGYGSIGYRYDWKREEAMKNILRTHTTAVSARMLYQIANQPGGFKPIKLFSIDRVFRNESLDATHLAEFHQVEGLVADYDLSLGDLIGVITAFFERIGITELRFKPAFNPYTEPSMEVFGYHPDLKKWTEIGNSGIFRPEMLLPMGLPENVRVIAWGLSLERPTMIKYRIRNIRDLFGHKVKFEMSRDAPIARFT